MQNSTNREYFPAERADLESYQPKRFNSRHRAVCLLLAQGFTNAEVAEITGYSESRVSTIKNDPRASEIILEGEKRFLDNLGDVSEKLAALAHEAVDEAADVLRNAKDENVRLRSAFGIMDRAGYGKVQKNLNMNVELGVEAVRELTRGEEDKTLEAIDAEYEIVSEIGEKV